MRPTRVTELYGITYPIIQAGMAWVSRAPLAAAVSEAGGLGIIGAATLNPDELCDDIRAVREATSKPFAVNFPIFNKRSKDTVQVILDEGVKFVFTSAGNPGLYTPAFHEAGVTVTHVVASPKHAVKAKERGVDALVCEGFEAGGHDSPDMISTLCLVPLVRDAVPDLPLLAAGGIADARQFAAAMALGADGVQIGTRFIATTENTALGSYKQAVVAADERGTIFTGRKVGPIRVLRNTFSERVLDAEMRGAEAEELDRLMHEKDFPRMGNVDGDMDEGCFDCGMGAALVHDIKSCRAVIDELVSGYERIRDSL